MYRYPKKKGTQLNTTTLAVVIYVLTIGRTVWVAETDFGSFCSIQSKNSYSVDPNRSGKHQQVVRGASCLPVKDCMLISPPMFAIGSFRKVAGAGQIGRALEAACSSSACIHKESNH